VRSADHLSKSFQKTLVFYIDLASFLIQVTTVIHCRELKVKILERQSE